jgi:hypothetical protein
MRRRGKGLGLLTASLLALTGCQKEAFLRPPKPPEQLIAPPTDDVRFSQPPEFPKNVLNEDRIKKPNSEKDSGAPGTMPHGGAMGRPGGPDTTY